LDDHWHGHAQSRREILHCHRFLLCGIRQEIKQAICQVLRLPGLIELDCNIFTIRHLAKIGQIGANDRNSIGACQVRYTTTSRGRRIGHYSY
jgi:hypothetical protein